MSKEHLNYLRRKTADEAELWAADRIEELERQLNQPVIMSEWQTLEQECDQFREQVKMLSAWIKQQGEITDTCTFHLLREVCENCACHRNKALTATEQNP